jgi:hypothetical protein
MQSIENQIPMDDKTKSPEKYLKDVKFLPESFNLQLNDENYSIMFGTLQEFIVINLYQETNIKNKYISFLTIEQLQKISKSMRYYDKVDEIINFFKEKAEKKEIFLKQEKENIFFEFSTNSPNGGIDNISLKLDKIKQNDEEIISILINKIDKLEKEIKILKEKLLASEVIIAENKKNIELLFKEIHLLKEKKENNNNENNNEEKNNNEKNNNENNNNNYNRINNRYNSEVLPNSNFYFNGNFFAEGKIPEFSYSYSFQNQNFPLINQSALNQNPINQSSIAQNSINKSGYELKQSIYSNSSNLYFTSTNDSDFYSFSNRNSIFDSRPSEKKFELNVDIKKVICLEDRRTTVMIKNIPNKFNRDMLLNIIDKNFKGAYDIFILPTDVNRYKNFGYSFINFTCSYYIPNFYYLFNGKKWSNTNSQKMCEITYSKIQGRNNLLQHYSNKIIFRNDEAKKYNNEKYIIPNEYKGIFTKAFPNQYIEEHEYHFTTKMPFKY